jgi:hypothetical protein
MLPEKVDSLADDVKPLVSELLRQNSGLTVRVNGCLRRTRRCWPASPSRSTRALTVLPSCDALSHSRTTRSRTGSRWSLAEEWAAEWYMVQLQHNMWVTSAMLGFSNRTGADQFAALLGVNWARSAEGWPPE